MEKKDEKQIVKEIEEYYSRWSEFGIERTTNAHIHLEQLKMLLLPTQVGTIDCDIRIPIHYSLCSFSMDMNSWEGIEVNPITISFDFLMHG